MRLQSPSPLLFAFVLPIIIPLASPLSFNYSSFSSGDDSIYYERAYAADNVIYLTRNLATIARATYAKPMRLYDRSSNNLTDFTTHFSFIIDSDNRTTYGDGLTFFLAPNGSRIPEGATKGGTLGLTTDNQRYNTTENTFVAVEFDIYYRSPYDPDHEHVGIDVNSLRSVENVTWWCDVRDGKQNEAWIRYDSESKNLSVVFTGFNGNDTIYQELYYIIDPREYLPEWVTFGFSAATGNQSATQSILSWSFSSTLQIGEGNATSPPISPSPSPDFSSPSSKKSNTALVVGLTVGGSVLVCALALILFVLRRQRNKEGCGDDPDFGMNMDDEFERGTGPKKFSYRELARATNNFATEQKLGEGGFGGVYRGFSKELNANVAVKRVSRDSKQGIKEYASEVRIISRLRHRNLVQLLGWCHEKKKLLLVYEYMENGSLDAHLFKEKSLLTWSVRYRIAQGIALALLYLHEEWEQCVIHRDIKSSNVMLDANFNAKLGDFGLARFVDHEKGSQTTVLAGTMGYMAPECVVIGKSSKESDVYSFGIVALEIACGRKPINHKAQENQVSMVEWVWELYGMGKLFEAADLKLCAEFNAEEMERLMIVGLWCAHPHNKFRPSIRQVVQVLSCEAALPVLPSDIPLVNYMAASMIRNEQNQSLSHSYSTHSSNQTLSSVASSSLGLQA